MSFADDSFVVDEFDRQRAYQILKAVAGVALGVDPGTEPNAQTIASTAPANPFFTLTSNRDNITATAGETRITLPVIVVVAGLAALLLLK